MSEEDFVQLRLDLIKILSQAEKQKKNNYILQIQTILDTFKKI